MWVSLKSKATYLQSSMNLNVLIFGKKFSFIFSWNLFHLFFLWSWADGFWSTALQSCLGVPYSISVHSCCSNGERTVPRSAPVSSDHSRLRCLLSHKLGSQADDLLSRTQQPCLGISWSHKGISNVLKTLTCLIHPSCINKAIQTRESMLHQEEETTCSPFKKTWLHPGTLVNFQKALKGRKREMTACQHVCDNSRPL